MGGGLASSVFTREGRGCIAPPPFFIFALLLFFVFAPPLICDVHVIDRLKIQFNDLPPST